MPSKEQTHHNDNTSSKQRVTKPTTENLDILTQQQIHPATIIRRARLDPSSLTVSDVRQLQRTMGNQAVGRLLVQRAPHKPNQKEASTDLESTINQSIQAKAFTTGQDVFFRQGAYEPKSREGRELIAHELTHGTTEERRIQRVAWTGAPALEGLDLTKITSSKLIYDAGEDGGVWRVSIEGKSYILKGTVKKRGQRYLRRL